MTRYLLDSYALMEYFRGTEKGHKVGEIISSPENTCYLAVVSIAEVVSSAIRQNLNLPPALDFMRAMRKLNLDDDSAEDAGRIHAQMRQKVKNFGLMDAALLSLARRNGLKLLTGDQHFHGVPEAVMI
jgi:predicted nucleic acid-binding protein